MDYEMDYIHSHLLNKEQVAICLGLLRNAKNNGNRNKWRYYYFMAKINFNKNHFDIIQLKVLKLTERKYW